MMRRVLISVLAGVTLMCGAWAATPAEAVISPSPLDCNITGGACSPLTGVGSLTFGGGPGTLTVSYQEPGFKIVGGVQLALNLTGVAVIGVENTPGVVVTGTGLTNPLTISIGSFQVDGCQGCFNFAIATAGPVGQIDESLPVGTAYTFTLTNLGLNGAASVVPGGPLNLDAMLHLNSGGPGGDSVFAAETGGGAPPPPPPGQAVPEPGTLMLLGSGLIGVGTLARRQSRKLFRK